MTVVPGSCSEEFCIVYIDGPLLGPVNPDLLTNVSGLLRRSERGIVLDLSRISLIELRALANWSAHTTSHAP